MLIDTMRAAKTIAELKNFQLTNLELQKLLYLTHMVYLGAQGEPLIEGNFEAWDYGPVQPDVYHLLKAYGGKNIRDIFPVDAFEEDTPQYKIINDAMQSLKNKTAGQLVQITHQQHGAWAKNYHVEMRNIIIPNEDNAAEYVARMAKINKQVDNSTEAP